MKMSKPGICCDDCFALLARKSTKVARLWTDLCDADHLYGIFGLVTPDSHHSLVHLEQMGFIVTTDTEDSIIVKVTKKNDQDEAFFYCGGICGNK